MIELLIDVCTGAEVVGLLTLLVGNTLLSIFAAIKNGVFSFRNLGDFIPNRVLPFVAYLVVALLAELVEGWVAGAIAVYAGLVAMYGAGCVAAIKSLTGIDIPGIFSERSE